MKHLTILIAAIFLISCGDGEYYDYFEESTDQSSSNASMDSDSTILTNGIEHMVGTDSDSIINQDSDTTQRDTRTSSSNDTETGSLDDGGDTDTQGSVEDTETGLYTDTGTGTTDTGTGTGSDTSSESIPDTGEDTEASQDTSSSTTDTSTTTDSEGTDVLDTDTNPECTIINDCPLGLSDGTPTLQYNDCVNGHCVLSPICPWTGTSKCAPLGTCGNFIPERYWNHNYRCEGNQLVCCQRD